VASRPGLYRPSPQRAVNVNALAVPQRIMPPRPPVVPVFTGSRQSAVFETATYLPLGVFTQTAGAIPAGQLQAIAQGNMRGHHLYLSAAVIIAPNNVWLATGLVMITFVGIGTYNVAIGTAGTPIGCYSPQAIYNPIIPGVPFTPGMPATVTFAYVGPWNLAAACFRLSGVWFGVGALRPARPAGAAAAARAPGPALGPARGASVRQVGGAARVGDRHPAVGRPQQRGAHDLQVPIAAGRGVHPQPEELVLGVLGHDA